MQKNNRLERGTRVRVIGGQFNRPELYRNMSGVVVRYDKGGASGIGSGAYVVDVGSYKSIWRTPEQIEAV
tara:strand:+ start:736 stop:945 length:210 start_codon:yes stop_codon:yes gene_type:complete